MLTAKKHAINDVYINLSSPQSSVVRTERVSTPQLTAEGQAVDNVRINRLSL